MSKLDTHMYTYGFGDSEGISPDQFDFSEDHVKHFVGLAVAELASEQCHEDDKPTNFRAYGWKTLVCDNDHSKIAFIECDQGYFFVTPAYPNYINVIRSRWD